jgi:copper oxidase (laccase) domain-containing protein
MSRKQNTHIEPVSELWPIYQPLRGLEHVGAAYTGKGTSPDNGHFSFQRPGASDPPHISKHFIANLQHLGHGVGFDPKRVTLPNGPWPQSGQAIKAEDYDWVTSPQIQTLAPISPLTRQPVTYDAIATRSDEFVLGVQGADCPAIFLHDPHAGVIGLAHAGWKPIVRGVVDHTVSAMVELGARPRDIVAFVSPGAGDQYNTFQWDSKMEPHVRDVSVEAGRRELLEDRSIRHEMTTQERRRLQAALGRELHGGTALKLSSLAVTELQRSGLSASNISVSWESSIVEKYPPRASCPDSFKYHSYRREQPNHGLSMSVLFLKSDAYRL